MDQPSPADLYAEWRAFDIAREAREMREEEAETRTGRTGIGCLPLAAPTEPVEPRRPCPCCDGSGFEPMGLTESRRTDRRYAARVTASGVPYGLEPGGRFLMVEAGGHTIERARGGRPSLDRLVDELADKLGKRAAAVELAKAMLGDEEHRAALDRLLQRWFRWPSEWESARKRIHGTVRDLGLSKPKATALIAALCSSECRGTWDD